ncbi:hypothetical protein EOM89_10425 [Candidatus Falkowbacteria bacterium]|nr:hypothetical protein [Candidatus Falkowbacteria bacterium]
MPDLDRADPLSDCLALLVKAGLDGELCARLIAQVRRRWGGGQAYIRAVDREAREAVIRDGLEAGEPVREIAKRAEVHPATVRRRRSGWL